IPTATVDGGDLLDVRGAAAPLLADIRAGAGPALLECNVTRIRPHYEGDLRRTGDDANDPVERFARALIDAGESTTRIEEVKQRAAADAAQVLARALEDPLPRPEDDATLVF